MDTGEVAYLVLVIAAFVIFAVTLARVSWRNASASDAADMPARSAGSNDVGPHEHH